VTTSASPKTIVSDGTSRMLRGRERVNVQPHLTACRSNHSTTSVRSSGETTRRSPLLPSSVLPLVGAGVQCHIGPTAVVAPCSGRNHRSRSEAEHMPAPPIRNRSTCRGPLAGCGRTEPSEPGHSTRAVWYHGGRPSNSASVTDRAVQHGAALLDRASDPRRKAGRRWPDGRHPVAIEPKGV
jgi:hypothetical protein